MSIVFVDDFLTPKDHGGTVKFWSHLFTFPPDEAALLKFGRSIGLKRPWLQNEGRPAVHFDVTDTMRIRAIDKGAAQCSVREAVAMIRKARQYAD